MNIIVALVFILVSQYSLAGPQNCLIQLNRLSGDPTSHLITYLDVLSEHRILKREHVDRFRESLAANTVTNPFSHVQGESDSTIHLHRQELQRLITGFQLDISKLIVWSDIHLGETSRIANAKAVAQAETHDTYQKMVFHPVIESKKTMTVQRAVIAPFEMMSTPVTQKQWVDLMGDNPSAYADGKHSITIVREGKHITLQPDNPVDNVSWWSAAHFANKLSIKAGLTPAYDFSNIIKLTGTVVGNFKMNSKDGFIEGYRLPSSNEIKAALQATGVDMDTLRSPAMLRHAWGFENTPDNKPQPVGQLDAFVINGKPFFDIFGNVHELTGNLFSDTLGYACVVRGGSFFTPFDQLADFERTVTADADTPGTGFRLVRSLR